jgi:hypothetical protein
MGGIARLLALAMRLWPATLRGIGALRLWLTRRKWGNWLIFFMASSVGQMLERFIYFLGISFVAYTWAAPVLINYVAVPLLGLPSQWQAFLAMTRLDDAATVMLSAVVYRVGSAFKVQRNASSPFSGVGGG